MKELSEPSGQVAIGVFGVSGVGKTTLISQFIAAYSGYIHLEASKLIKESLAKPVLSSEHLRSMEPSAIEVNQIRLTEQFRVARRAHPKKTVILDAHSVIDSDPHATLVSVEIIRELELKQMIFIRDRPDAIARRRDDDSNRRRPMRSVRSIAQLQNMALDQCQVYAVNLGLPLNLTSPMDLAGFALAAQLCVP